MIVAIIIGREGSVAFPGKNVHPVLGRPLTAYPLMAAQHSRYIDKTYMSTDSPRLQAIAREYGAEVLERPEELATSKALAEDAYAHAYRWIKDDLGEEIEIVVLLFCNAATILGSTIDEGIERLREDTELDSAVTVSSYNMWSPIRARRIDDQGLVQPFAPLESYGDLNVFTCDRDSQGDVYFADMSVSIVRPRCLEDLEYGVLPQRWMGQRIHPLIQTAGCDVDYAWQIPGVQAWLLEHGFTDTNTAYED